MNLRLLVCIGVCAVHLVSRPFVLPAPAAERPIETPGLLLDSSGRPLPNARLYVRNHVTEAVAGAVATYWAWSSAVTDGEGRFTFSRAADVPTTHPYFGEVRVLPFVEGRWQISRVSRPPRTRAWRVEELSALARHVWEESRPAFRPHFEGPDEADRRSDEWLKGLVVSAEAAWVEEDGKLALRVQAPDLGEIRVVVLGPDHRPLAKAPVEVYPAERWPQFRDGDTLRFRGSTDEQGVFRMRLTPGLGSLHIVAPGVGFGAAGTFEVVANQEMPVRLGPLARFGTVSGYAAPELLSHDDEVTLATEHAWNRTAAEFDEKGRFTLHEVTPGDVALRVRSATEFARRYVRVAPGEHVREVELTPAPPPQPPLPQQPAPQRREAPPAYVAGRVAGPDGEPEEGVRVLVRNLYHGGLRMSEQLFETRTDDVGEYRVDGIRLAGACVFVTAYRPGDPPAFKQGRVVGPNGERLAHAGHGGLLSAPLYEFDELQVRADLVLPRSASRLKVRVLDTAGQPVNAGTVRLESVDWQRCFPYVWGGSPELREEISQILRPMMKVDHEGCAEFDDLLPGEYAIVATTGDATHLDRFPLRRLPEGIANGERRGIAVVAGEQREARIVVLPPRTAIDFRVFHPDGEMLADASIAVDWSRAGAQQFSSSSLKADPQGIIQFDAEQNGLWHVDLRFRDSPLKRIPIRSGPHYRAETVVAISHLLSARAPIDLHAVRVGGSSVLDVALQDRAGQPAVGTVVIEEFIGLRTPPRFAATTDKQGKARFSDVPPGQYRVAGYLHAVPALPDLNVDIDDEQLTDRSVVPKVTVDLAADVPAAVTLRQSPVGYVRGTVSPLPDDDASHYSVGFEPIGDAVGTTTVFDPETGRFVYGPVLPGEVRVKVFRTSLEQARLEQIADKPIDAQPGEVTKIQLVLQPGDERPVDNPVSGSARWTPIAGEVVHSNGTTPAYRARVLKFLPEVDHAVSEGWSDAAGRFDTFVAFMRPAASGEESDAPGSPERTVVLAYLPGLCGGTVVGLDEDQTEGVRLVLPRPASVSGKVTIGGRPAADFPAAVRIRAQYQGRGKLNPWLSIDTTADRDGSFTLYGLTPGRYLVQAALDGIWLSESVPLTVSPNDDPPVLELTIETPGAATSVEFHDPQGEPLQARPVRVVLPEGPLAELLHPKRRHTDGHGFVRLEGLTAGTKRILTEGALQPVEVEIPELMIKPLEPGK